MGSSSWSGRACRRGRRRGARDLAHRPGGAHERPAPLRGAPGERVVLFSHNGTLRAEVSDDGRDFDPGALPSGVGTMGMRERVLGLGGRIEVEGEPGAGTTVRFEAPLQNLLR